MDWVFLIALSGLAALSVALLLLCARLAGDAAAPGTQHSAGDRGL